MESLVSPTPFLAVLVSAAAIVPIVLCGRRANLREGSTFVAAGVKWLLVLSMVPLVLEGKVIEWTLADIAPGVAIEFRVDALGMVFGVVASSLWIATSAFSIGYMRGLKEHSQTRYYAFFALALSSTIRRWSAVRNGSHSAPLSRSVSIGFAAGGFNLIAVGNAAPPR